MIISSHQKKKKKKKDDEKQFYLNEKLLNLKNEKQIDACNANVFLSQVLHAKVIYFRVNA